MLLARAGTFFKLGWRLQLLLLFNFCLAIYSWLLFKFFNSRARFKSRPNRGQVKGLGREGLITAKEIRWSIAAINKTVFWNNVCRHQALQAVILCRYFNIPYQISIGIKKGANFELEAHVWTIAAGKMITGDCEPAQYKVLQQFEG
ncbi:lasso peptide biosynthesis B2 protein [Pedobacter sp. MC2016-14]|uniref:lasso peptide biosynthesis B2 protein n=1 Tax=Pedobacter sp. MC2016-14 TaxID=2897327 RepID=UPI001E5A80A9|nr:lasso peptide biosynthesis B2 protein [Pedobacter sp. MC2016-14]MCD0486929.1 lasso peptide biosynthesis B2 protein [Pedobacter sp. MC2016-14]